MPPPGAFGVKGFTVKNAGRGLHRTIFFLPGSKGRS